ncbi:hypothetical protein E4U09_008171 [Claviceps aff. purpurea]|uniref:NADH:flavin oxidoreductase/NADH oxidase N-terminal domain-containing protein n=1 Tax=Claviceps aff. purpurea TaxID=1967640 RepID=A0A9P7QJV1_9HYPO|nr:hypothetical protein E4U09_008171 [Claviceps aff. purpurea]
MDLKVAEPLTLPCGLTIPNRLAKAAVAEGWGDKRHLPHEKLIQTYSSWADGEWGLILTGNVQVDIEYLGQPEDNCANPNVPREELLETWKRWAKSANGQGSKTIVQLNHPGRQSLPGAGTHGFFKKTIAPSPVQVNLGQGLIAKTLSKLVFGTPREMTAADIQHVVTRFAEAAKLCHEAGFSGVEIHGAHGYLLAQFLSAKTNHRSDDYGGSPKKRAKIVVDILRAVRAEVPKEFCVGIKLNSVDHQSEKELEDCIEQLEDIVAAGIDFLEISGGSYEDPVVWRSYAAVDRDLLLRGEMKCDALTQLEHQMMTGRTSEKVSERTLAREAFFLEFAHAIRSRFEGVPLMVTGGFRTRKGMEAAIREGGCDIIGIGRPAVLNPLLPKNTIFNKEIADDDAKLYTKTVAPSWLSRVLGLRAINGAAETVCFLHHTCFNQYEI